MPPQSNCLPLAVSVVNWLWCSNSYSVAQINGLVWFLREQITTEMVYHVVFRQNAKRGHRICLADLDPVAFRQAAHPPVATLSLVVTSVSCFCFTCRFQTLISSVLRCLVRLLWRRSQRLRWVYISKPDAYANLRDTSHAIRTIWRPGPHDIHDRYEHIMWHQVSLHMCYVCVAN